MSLGAFATSLVMCYMNCGFSYAYAIGVQFLFSGAARSSMCWIPIVVSSFCWSLVMPARCSVLLCVVVGSVDSAVGVRAISMLSSSSCCSRLSAQKLDVSSMGEVNRPRWNLLQCNCLCHCGHCRGYVGRI